MVVAVIQLRKGSVRLVYKLAKHSFESLALKVSHVVVQLVSQRLQWTTTGPASQDFPQ